LAVAVLLRKMRMAAMIERIVPRRLSTHE